MGCPTRSRGRSRSAPARRETSGKAEGEDPWRRALAEALKDRALNLGFRHEYVFLFQLLGPGGLRLVDTVMAMPKRA
jgi:hypothetical protein